MNFDSENTAIFSLSVINFVPFIDFQCCDEGNNKKQDEANPISNFKTHKLFITGHYLTFVVVSPLVAQPSYSLSYLNIVPKSAWGSSSREYGQVSESGVVEKTTEQLEAEARQPSSTGGGRTASTFKKGVEAVKKTVEQAKELVGKAKYQASKFLVEYLQWKTGKLQKPESQEGKVSVDQAFTMIDDAEKSGTITAQQAQEYRDEVLSQVASSSVKGRAETGKFQTVERVGGAFASTLTPQAVGTSVFLGGGGAIINKGSTVAISSGVPALVVSGILLKGGLIALSGIKLYESYQQFKGLEAPEQFGVALGTLPLVFVASASYKITTNAISLIPEKTTGVSSDFKAIKEVSQREAIVTTEQKQTIINIPKTQRGVEGINYKVNEFELTSPSSSFLVRDESIPTGILRVGNYGGKTVEIYSNLDTGITVANIFSGTSPDVRSYAFTTAGKVFGFDVSTASWKTPIIKGMFYSGKATGGVESVIISPITTYSEQNIKITTPAFSEKGAGIWTEGRGGGVVFGDVAKTRFREGELGIFYKTKFFRTGEAGGYEVFSGASPPELRIKQDIFTEYVLGKTSPSGSVTSSGGAGISLEGIPDFIKTESSKPSILTQLYGGGGGVAQTLSRTADVVVNIPKIEVAGGGSVFNVVTSPASPASVGSGDLRVGVGLNMWSVWNGVKNADVSSNLEFAGFDQAQKTKQEQELVLKPALLQKTKTEVVVTTKTKSNYFVRSEQKVKTEQIQKTDQKLILSTLQVPMFQSKVTVTPSKVNMTKFDQSYGRFPRASAMVGFGRGRSRSSTPNFRMGFVSRQQSSGRTSGRARSLLVTRSPNIVLFKGSRGIPRQSRGLEQRFLRTAIKTPASYSFDPFKRRKR